MQFSMHFLASKSWHWEQSDLLYQLRAECSSWSWKTWPRWAGFSVLLLSPHGVSFGAQLLTINWSLNEVLPCLKFIHTLVPSPCVALVLTACCYKQQVELVKLTSCLHFSWGLTSIGGLLCFKLSRHKMKTKFCEDMPEYVAYYEKCLNQPFSYTSCAVVYISWYMKQLKQYISSCCIFVSQCRNLRGVWEKVLTVGEFNPLTSVESEVSQAGLHTCACIVLHFCLIDWESFKHSMLLPGSLSEWDQEYYLGHFLKLAAQVKG